MKQKSTIIFFGLIICAGILWYGGYHRSSAIDLKTDIAIVSDECGNSDRQLECWQQLLRRTLEQRGLPAAFDTLAELYSTQPAFAAECHSFAHQLGEDAYLKFSSHEDFELNSKTSYCGYGFYHGFMEAMLQSTKDTRQAQEFCSYVGKQLAGQTTDGEGACYHGIGHGAVDGTNIAAWGNPQAMIEPGLNLCKIVAVTDMAQFGKFFRCISGAYNALEILSADSKYKLDMIQKNPFYLCPFQPEFNKEACYTNMLPALLRFNSDDMVKSEKVVEQIPEKNTYALRTQVSASLWDEYIRTNLNQADYNIESAINSCHSFTDPFRLSCINGLSDGHMKYGEPTKEYVKSLAFCANQDLRPDEHDSCYQWILSRLRIWYTVSKAQEICSSIPEEFKKYCLNI